MPKDPRRRNPRLYVRTSERSDFTGCRQRWWWGYVERLRTPRPAKALTIGDMFHQSLGVGFKKLPPWYKPGRKRGTHPAKLFEKIYNAWIDEGNDNIYFKEYPDSDKADVTGLELGIEMLDNYVKHWGNDEHLEIIAPELAFQVDVHVPETDDYLYTYVGQIDGVIRDHSVGGAIGFIEHKTGVSLEPFSAPIQLDEQSGSYWAFAPAYLKDKGLIDNIDDVSFVLFNRARKSFKDTRPVNEDGLSLNKPRKDDLLAACHHLGIMPSKGATMEVLSSLLRKKRVDPEQLGAVSGVQPLPLFKRERAYRSPADRLILMDRVAQQVSEMRDAKAGILPIYKRPSRDCGFCEYLHMCEIHETGSDWEAMKNSLYGTWEPYEAHEVAQERSHG